MSGGLDFLAGGGRAARMIAERDWSSHPLGPPSGWPPALRVSLSLVLNSPESMILAWGPDLHFFFNDTYFPLLGPRLSWAMGERFDRVWADAWEQAKPIIDEALAGRARRFVDLPWKLDTDRGPADTWFTFSYSRVLEAGGEVAGLFILTNETTDRVLGDAALRRSQSDLEAALTELHDLNASLNRQVEERTRERDRIWRLSTDIMLVGDFTGRIEAVNPAWTRLLGWDTGELVGRDFMSLIHPDDVPQTLAEVARLSAGVTTLRFENRYRHKDGSYRWLSWTAVPDDRFIHAVGRDVQAEKEATDALKTAEDALRQSQKMEAVGQLTGGLAHDFNNLLAGISGSLELMQTRIGEGRIAEVERYLVAAQGAARRAAALTHRLLAFSRRQTLDPKPTDIDALVAGMEELVRRTVGPAITVETKVGTDVWPVLVDPNQLENALLNLCINARDAMPHGGRLMIETTNHRFDERAAREHDLEPGAYVAMCVVDDGTGMEPDVLERAMEPFFTTKPIGVGTGLGLSMIYGFARQSGGQVRIRSRGGEGTTVCVYLPRHLGTAEAPENRDAGRAPEPAARRVGETVLVVDDEPLVRMLVVDVLEDLGYRTIEAEDGPSAMKVLRSDEALDLLVTDVGLPNGMNGRQVADAARALRPDLKVLFVTGYAENAVLNHGDLDPGMHIVTKPFQVEDLGRRVSAIVAEGR